MNASGLAGTSSPVLFTDDESERENRLNLKPIIKSLKKLEPATIGLTQVAKGSQVPGGGRPARPALPDIGAHLRGDTARRRLERADAVVSSHDAHHREHPAKRQRTDSGHGLSDESMELNDVRGDALPSASDDASDAKSDASDSGSMPSSAKQSRSRNCDGDAPRLRFVPPSDFSSFASDRSADHITIEDALEEGHELWLLEVPADVGVDVLSGLELSLDESHQQLTVPDSQSCMHLEAISSRWMQSGMDATILLPDKKRGTGLQAAPTPVGIIQIVKAIDVANVASDHSPISCTKGKHKKKSSRAIRPLPDGLKIRYKPIGCSGSFAGSVPSNKKDRKTKKGKRHLSG